LALSLARVAQSFETVRAPNFAGGVSPPVPAGRRGLNLLTAERDLDRWVSASRTRNFLLGDPLLDWLALYGEQKGLIPDDKLPGFDPRTAFGPFIVTKGCEFELAVVALLRTRCQLVSVRQSREDTRDPAKAQETLRAMTAGVEVIHQGVLRDEVSCTYGSPDLLVRSDVLERLFQDPYAFEMARSENRQIPERVACGSGAGAPLLAAPHHYRVVDIKFTTLHLLKSGELSNSGSAPAYKAQVFIYNRALGRLQGYEPPAAFLLGRTWEQSKLRGSGCFERLAAVPQDGELAKGEGLAEATAAAVEWIRRVRSEGAQWSVLPSPDCNELRPNMKNTSDAPWHSAKRRIAEEAKELTQMWQIGVARRDALVRGDGGIAISRWDDSRLTPALAGVSGQKQAPVLQAILDVNRPGAGEFVQPKRVQMEEQEWRYAESVEFFVDFETVSDLNDDFTSLPERGGQPLIFMLGCGHLENGQFVFKCFTADSLNEHAEARVLDGWFAHMAATALRLGYEGAPRVFHWSPAEESTLETAYNSAKRRHLDHKWPEPRWFDFLNRVVRQEPVVCRGALGFGLKAIGKALYALGLISTSWQDGPTDGLGAMVAAWSAAKEAREGGAPLCDIELMREVGRYNEVDCRVMSEIISYLRAKH
jgi:hypothetical protein